MLASLLSCATRAFSMWTVRLVTTLLIYNMLFNVNVKHKKKSLHQNTHTEDADCFAALFPYVFLPLDKAIVSETLLFRVKSHKSLKACLLGPL